MRPSGYALVLALGLVSAGVAAETTLQRPLDLPALPTAPERDVARDSDGRAAGSSDGSVLREPDGRATGSVRPNPGGSGSGSTLRDSDGRLRGIQPTPAPLERFRPR